jgi:hypothetical protein
MAKRMTGTEKWDKAWFRKLSPRHKALWEFLRDKCDQAGMWEVDFDNASHFVNDAEPITAKDLEVFGNRLEWYSPEKIWIVGFCDFQYVELSEKSPAHKPVFKLLKKYNLLDRVLNRVSHTLQEKEIDKEEEKEEEKEKEIHVEFVKQSETFNTGYQVPDKPDKLLIFEEIFSDETLLESLTMQHKGKNIKNAWEECWVYHINGPSPPQHAWQWKQKLISWLINTKNGNSKTEQRTNGFNARREAFAKRHSSNLGS